MKLCLSTWSLRHHINKDFPFHEFPRVALERYGIRAVELCQMHFPPPDSRRLDQLLADRGGLVYDAARRSLLLYRALVGGSPALHNWS